jgi:hypothetical protein
MLTSLGLLLEQLYGSQERLTRDEIHRRAVLADLPAEALSALDALPEGEYSHDEVSAAMADVAGFPRLPDEAGDGVPATTLSDEDLMRELATVHRTRNDTLRHASSQALETHTQRMDELEAEYRSRFPEREIDPEREREGARQRSS